MDVNSTRVWAPSNTGTKAHAFLGSRGAKEGNMRAGCRSSIQRSADANYVDLPRARKFYSVCERCVTLYYAAVARAEESMRAATEAHDVGYVTPADDRQDEAPAPEAVPAEAAPVAAGTEDDPVTVNGDTLVRVNDYWARVTLDNGRTYVVSLSVQRKGDRLGGHVIWDYATYWAEREGKSFGSTLCAGENSRPTSVGGRIWALLVAAEQTCETCSWTGPNVATMDDPFTSAMYPEDTDHEKVILCPSCAVARFEES